MPILLYYGVDKGMRIQKGYKYERNRASMQNYALFQTSKPGKACRKNCSYSTANISNLKKRLVRISLDLALSLIVTILMYHWIT